jgi:ABC-type multidrug transport system fused ATPase/permease subunit
MTNFWRSLRYLLPYKGKLIVSVICVILMTVLWAGGIGMVAPGSQVLIGEQGVHGWAYDKIVSDRLDCSISMRLTPAETPPLDGVPLVEVIDIVSAAEKTRAYKAGFRKGDWIVGLVDGDPNHLVIRGEKVVRMLAAAEVGTKVPLRVLDPVPRKQRTVSFSIEQGHWSSRVLKDMVGWIPESATRLQLFMGLLVLVIVTTLLRNILRFVQEYFVETAVNQSILDIRCENYTTVLHLPTVYFAVNGATDVMSRFVQDMQELREGHITLFGKTLAEPAKLVGSVAAALWCSWKLTLLAMLVGPPSYWLIRQFGRRMKRVAKKMLESWSDMIATLEETLTGIRVVKAYTMEGAERKRFFRVNRKLLKQFNKIAKIEAASSPAIECLGVVGSCGAAAVAGYWVISGAMKPGDFIAFLVAMAAMFDPIRKLSKVATRFQRSEAAAARIFQLQDIEREKVVLGAPPLARHRESIEFRGVNFRYPGVAEDTLRDINLTIRAGLRVAIVGPNGSGKTTLVSLLPRLLDATGGQILIDGHDISRVSVRSLRRQIGLVTQETVLFHATIGENVAYGLRRPKPEAVLEASKKAFVDEFVRELPDGYDTMVGEHGATLSGGQRQRITIARAILRDPAILIFDEALSQVDADSEKRIQQAMEEFCRGRTTLLIAHRFQTVIAADMIVVMDAGRIIATGTHAELLAGCPLYKNLYDTQFAGG